MNKEINKMRTILDMLKETNKTINSNNKQDYQTNIDNSFKSLYDRKDLSYEDLYNFKLEKRTVKIPNRVNEINDLLNNLIIN